jgi:Flp pilus assembly protein CpaB
MAATLDKAMVSPELPAPRRPRLGRLSGAHLLIALAAVVAVVANYAVLRAQDGSVRVAVVDRELAAGDLVDAGDLAFADVRAEAAVLRTLVTAAELERFAGHVAAVRLRAGDPLRRSDLQRPAAARRQRAMSLPLAAEHAVGGRLNAGDRVDVIEVRDGRAAYLLVDAEVLAVPEADLRTGLAAMQSFSVTLAVDDDSALRLALAERHSDLHLVRSTGATPIAIERLDPPPAPTVQAQPGADPEVQP